MKLEIGTIPVWNHQSRGRTLETRDIPGRTVPQAPAANEARPVHLTCEIVGWFMMRMGSLGMDIDGYLIFMDVYGCFMMSIYIYVYIYILYVINSGMIETIKGWWFHWFISGRFFTTNNHKTNIADQPTLGELTFGSQTLVDPPGKRDPPAIFFKRCNWESTKNYSRIFPAINLHVEKWFPSHVWLTPSFRTTRGRILMLKMLKSPCPHMSTCLLVNTCLFQHWNSDENLVLNFHGWMDLNIFEWLDHVGSDILNHVKWCQMMSNDIKWYQMISNDIEWYQMISNDIKWYVSYVNDISLTYWLFTSNDISNVKWCYPTAIPTRYPT